MRIAIDARKLRDFGIGTYIRNILMELSRLDRATEYVVLCRPDDLDTGDVLGTTPLEVKLEKKEGTVTLKFELEGRQTLERAVSMSRNSALSVDLAALPPPAPEKPEKPERKAPERPRPAPKKKASKALNDADEK